MRVILLFLGTSGSEKWVGKFESLVTPQTGALGAVFWLSTVKLLPGRDRTVSLLLGVS